jgi:AcrR family transcriptional regulator
MEAKLPRRERERLRHRQEILEAARKVLADRGLDGLTVDLVAREADFAVGSIYRHFRSKEELIEVMVNEFLEPIFEDMEAMPASGLPFRAQLEQMVRDVHTARVEALPLFQALMTLPGRMPSLHGPEGDRMRAIMRRYFTALDAVLVVGQAEGALPPGDRTTMRVALAGLMDMFSKWCLFGPTPPEGDVGPTVCRAFLEGFGARS